MASMKNQSTPAIKQYLALIKIESFDSSLSFIQNLAKTIVSDLNLKVVSSQSHLFKPEGITLVYILSQSHLAIHTYPEKHAIHVDLALCINQTKKKFEKSLHHALDARKIYSLTIKSISFP